MSHNRYIQFYKKNRVTGKTDELLGSDGIMPLDGRWSLNTCIDKAREHAARLNKNLNKGIVGMKVMQRGTAGMLNATCVGKYHDFDSQD